MGGFNAVQVPATGGGGGGPVEKTSDDLLWETLQSGSYSDGDLFKNTTTGMVFSAQCTSESFGGVLIPAAWAGYANIRLQTSTAPWPSGLDAAYGSDPRTAGTVGKAFMLKDDAIADLTGSGGRGFAARTTGIGVTATKTAGGNLVLNSNTYGSSNSSRLEFAVSDRETSWSTSPSYTGNARQILAIRSKSISQYDSDGRGPAILLYGLRDNTPTIRHYTRITPNVSTNWLGRWNTFGVDVTTDGGYKLLDTGTGDVWIYCLLDLVGDATQQVYVEGSPGAYSYTRADMVTSTDSSGAGWATYVGPACYGWSAGPVTWEIEQMYFLAMDS